METKQQTAAILRKAAKVMLEGGYIAGIRYGADVGSSSKAGAHCALGAIEVAAGMHKYTAGNNTPAVIALARALNPDEVASGVSKQAVIASWNNASGMNAKKVACVMNAAAEEMEETNGTATEDT